MKKVLAFILTLLTVFVLVSCGSGSGSSSSSSTKLSVDKVTDNLTNAGYEITEIDEDEINEIIEDVNEALEMLGQEMLTGKITSALEAYDEEKDATVIVYEFESSSDAKKILDAFEQMGFHGQRDGKVVIITKNEDALNDAVSSGSSSSGNGSIGGGTIGGGTIGGGTIGGGGGATVDPPQKVTTTVYFDPNGGYGDVETVEVLFYEGFNIPEFGMYKDGYKLVGWSKDPYATDAEYSVNGWYYNDSDDESATLYAVWDEAEFIMWFQPNGADASAVVITVSSDGFYLPYNNFVRDGYIFTGWSLDPDSAVGEYSEDAYFDSYEGTLNFYAIWQKSEATVIFNSNDGKSQTTEVLLTNGAILTIPDTYFERYGYAFVGWSTDSAATEAEYLVGESFYNAPFMEEVYFYAIWEKNETPVIDIEGLYERDGDTIYFGSYPQTQVTDSYITEALSGMAGELPSSYDSYDWTSYGYYADDYSQNYMWYIDLEYEGECYRGVYFTSYRPIWNNESVGSSNSDQDDNGYYTYTTYWFKYEPVAWKVLSENDSEAFIVADLVIDSQPYNNQTDVAGYSSASVRDWLNETFYETTFNELERQIILSTEVDNSDSGYDTSTTTDKIFLLSENEVEAYNYFVIKGATDYAFSQGLLKSNGKACYWFLRTSTNSENVKVVNTGSITTSAQTAFTRGGILPAMRIMLSGEIEGGQDNPSIDIDGLYERDGDTVYFGSYPQTQVTDSYITEALNQKAGELPTSSYSYNWTSYKYYSNGYESDFMWYIDLEYDGEYYRGVYFTQYRSCWTQSYNTHQQGSYYTYNVYWFKYEPIKWNIISENGEEAIIIADLILDSKEYTTNEGNQNYEYTTIREWLNDTFYETAFNELQKQLVLTTSIDGYLEDKVYILSTDEVYMYISDYGKSNTDYAQCQGLENSKYWRLRGATSRSDYSFACKSGEVTEIYKYYTPAGVVPVVKIYLGKAEQQKPSVEIDGLYERDGDTVYFGSYPQTQVTDSYITEALNQKAGELPTSSYSYNWTSYKYYSNGYESDFMWYIDLEYEGEYYRGVYFDSYRTYYTDESGSNQSSNGYYTYQTYWFKYEPISWTVIEEESGYVTLLCDMIIDSQEYDDSHSNTDYYSSNIRAWLLSSFYETAFNSEQKNIIALSGDYNDQVILLDYDDVSYYSSSLLAKNGTDYAMIQGLYDRTSHWWLDIYGCGDNYVINEDGGVDTGIQLNYTSWGVVPVVTIMLGE